MKIGDVSNELGIPASTIRYYESEGLIDRQSRISGIRDFNKKSITTLRFVQLAQQTGFSINEIKSLLESYDRDSNVSGAWESIAREKRISIQNQIEDLQRMDVILSNLLDCDCKSLNACVNVVLKSVEKNAL